MTTYRWQKSSFCGQGESCIYIATHRGTVHLTESSDPSKAILQATPAAWATLVRTVKKAADHN